MAWKFDTYLMLPSAQSKNNSSSNYLDHLATDEKTAFYAFW